MSQYHNSWRSFVSSDGRVGIEVKDRLGPSVRWIGMWCWNTVEIRA